MFGSSNLKTGPNALIRIVMVAIMVRRLGSTYNKANESDYHIQDQPFGADGREAQTLAPGSG